MTTPLTIGVVGLGSIGRRHARLLAGCERVDVRAFDEDPGAAADLTGVTSMANVDELLATCDGVVIATPMRSTRRSPSRPVGPGRRCWWRSP